MVLYAGIVHDGRNYMFFTMDEAALIDGLIATYFVSAPLFHGSIQFEKDIWSVIAKTQKLLKESSPVAE